MSARILLIEPKSPDVNIYSKFKMPRMGLAILGTLAERAGYQVRILYQEAVEVTSSHLLWADLIGFSLTTSTSEEGYRLAHVARGLGRYRETPVSIVFGGVHPTFRPEEALAHGDYVFRGEAEEGFVPFLDALFGAGVDGASGAEEATAAGSNGAGGGSAGGGLDSIPGLSRWREGEVVHNPLPERWVDMDSLPTPNWELFEGFRTKIGGVMTSRGCPYNCSFCSVTAMLGRDYRMRSIEKIIDDLAATEASHVFFYDDHFLANPPRTRRLLERIIEEKGRRISVKDFSAQVRVNIAAYPDILDLMKKANLHTLYIGFESVNRETLELYNKHQSLRQIVDSIREIKKRGLWIHGMFVLGSDADREETFVETVKFAKKNRIDSVQFLILTPFPGTRQFQEFEKEGRVFSYDWSRYDGFQAVYIPRYLSPYRLQLGTYRAMRRFYTWTRILSSLSRAKLYQAAVRLYGNLSLKKWYRHNRRRLLRLKMDDRFLFAPLLESGSASADGSS